ncbi:MAG TPA: hypothetical protein VNN55_00935 [bacterium]|nr:hypothetical protein [bacterium]
MRNWLKALAPLAICGLLLGLASCEGDEGPAGPPGTALCMDCHTDDFTMANYLRPIQDQYAISGHNMSDTYVRRGTDASPSCSKCHTTEGFQHYVATGEELPLEESSHISCFACHAPHTYADFSLRVTAAIDLNYGGKYDRGLSNTCAVCHQARPTDPSVDSPNPITVTRWGPHYAPQANVLSGQGAYEFPDIIYEADAAHRAIADGCVECHMAELPDNVIAGGHSFAINYESGGKVIINSKGCSCHGWASDTTATRLTREYQDSFEQELSELGDLLADRGWLSADREYASRGAGAPPPGEPRGAVLNYLLLRHDKSRGVHNKKYAESVLAATKAWVMSH